MSFPVVPVVMPADLAGAANGHLPSRLLTSVHGGGSLHHLAGRAWRALLDAAWSEVGLPLTFTYGGTYRSYQQQETLFRSRYAIGATGGGCKTWNGERWCKKSPNLATAAVPGTSNHGWGLAIDCAWDRDLSDGIGPDDATGITSHPGWAWLLKNAHRFGFSWELQSEPWHLRYVTGDKIPAAVLAFENPTTESTEVEMIAIKYNRPADGPGAWTGCMYTGTHLAHVTTPSAWSIPTGAGAPVVEVNDKAQMYDLIRSAQTTNPCPPEFVNTDLGAAWTGSRV